MDQSKFLKVGTIIYGVSHIENAMKVFITPVAWGRPRFAKNDG